MGVVYEFLRKLSEILGISLGLSPHIAEGYYESFVKELGSAEKVVDEEYLNRLISTLNNEENARILKRYRDLVKKIHESMDPEPFAALWAALTYPLKVKVRDLDEKGQDRALPITTTVSSKQFPLVPIVLRLEVLRWMREEMGDEALNMLLKKRPTEILGIVDGFLLEHPEITFIRPDNTRSSFYATPELDKEWAKRALESFRREIKEQETREKTAKLDRFLEPKKRVVPLNLEQ